MWIDRVVELEPGRRLVAVKSVSLSEEHLHDHFAADAARGLPAMPVMPGCFIVEGMAQTGGILVGHAEHFAQKVILAKISKAELTREAFPGDTLRYTALIERMDEQGASVKGTVEIFDHARPERGYAALGTIDLVFSHLDSNTGAGGQSGVDFPAHNFVFGESFKTLLRSSGVGS
ncbi:MAG: beta-hydroxyacyl-ACP dehydratase [Phycisphaerales bacterium]